MQNTLDMSEEAEFDEEEEPSFSDTEDFVDDIEDDGKLGKEPGFCLCGPLLKLAC